MHVTGILTQVIAHLISSTISVFITLRADSISCLVIRSSRSVITGEGDRGETGRVGSRCEGLCFGTGLFVGVDLVERGTGELSWELGDLLGVVGVDTLDGL